MKILVVPTTDWIRHPVPNRLNFIFDRIAKRHEVYVIHFDLKRFSRNRSRTTNCELIYAGRPLASDLALYYLLGSPRHARIIKSTILEKGIDVVVCANVLPSLLASLTSGDTPLVFDYLDLLEESVAIYYPNNVIGKLGKVATRVIVSKILASAALITTVTDEFRKHLNSRGFTNVRVIPNGVDASIIRPIPTDQAKRELGIDGLVLGYVGSLEYWIDLEPVIRSIPELCRLGMNPRVLIVGPRLVTDYSMTLHRLARQLGVEDRVIFSGSVPYGSVSRYISAMDICLNPRKPLTMNTMTMGSKVLTYLACGKPVLSTNMPVLESYFGPSNGVFPYEKRTFIGRVIELAGMSHDPDMYRLAIREFDWDTLAERYEGILERVQSN